MIDKDRIQRIADQCHPTFFIRYLEEMAQLF
jgi:hypothetical protein